MTRNNWLGELLAKLPPALEGQPPEGDRDYDHFDPDRDDLGDVIQDVENWASERENFGQWSEALAWVGKSVGLDFSALQARWKDIPVILVPEHVSEEPRGLFGHLDQIRLAYLVGADLAATALCRTTTEVLIRYHYANHVPDAQDPIRTKLTGSPGKGKLNLIEHAEVRHEFLQHFNLAELVKYANEILHQPATGKTGRGLYSIEAKHRDPARGVVIAWMSVQYEMIGRAGSTAAANG
jgi:hypothetical protein